MICNVILECYFMLIATGGLLSEASYQTKQLYEMCAV